LDELASARDAAIQETHLNQAAPAPSGAKLSLPAAYAFASPQIAMGALTLAVAVHMPRYFASTLGMSLAVVGTAFALVRFVDIPLDPFLGLVMDRTRTPFGRYRAWTMVGAPVLMGALYMLISARAGLGQAYLMGWLLIMYLGFSIAQLSNLAWAASLATNYERRSRIFGVFTALGVAGAVAVLVIPVLMAKLGHSDGEGVRAMLWFIFAVAPIGALLAAWRTPEPLKREHSEHRFALRDYLTLLTRGNVIRLLVADICVTLGPGWMAAIYLFFFKDSRGFNTTQANLLLLIYIAAGFIGAPATAWLANKVSKHRALMINTTVYSLMLSTLLLAPHGVFLAAVPTMFICGAAASGLTVVIRAITGDIGDELQLENGRHWMGLMYSLINATQKIASAGSIFLTFNVLAMVGYNAKEGAVNSPRAILSLDLVYMIGPVVFVMLGGACFLGYKLTAARHHEIRRQLEARDALFAEPAIVQTISGGPGEAPPIRS
jgi:GPH family glycoside/pentoside/hexuronide:cation symporter